MRLRLSNGEPEKPLIVHVGRLGVEKSLDFLISVMGKLPEARIAFIEDGPYRYQAVFLMNVFRYQASKVDITIYSDLQSVPSSEYESVFRWFKLIDALLRISYVPPLHIVTLLLSQLVSLLFRMNR
ncbi:uncharacterized protein LOC131593435 [Vicia villosa]|uniref:uncharacterized protein LOC131593435 n=1 Tax=Vicia villosa TaxID=3911 RepID=UPI00273ADC97|nr:uncharacterized protein LOC131593435 [Vicia villosa]